MKSIDIVSILVYIIREGSGKGSQPKKQTGETEMEATKEKIASLLAANHLNYLCANSGKIIKMDIEKAMAQHTKSYLERIDSIISVVKRLKTEDAWVAAGNHKMSVMPWSDFYMLCE